MNRLVRMCRRALASVLSRKNAALSSDPSADLRRCEADGRTVARHRLYLGQCTGCTRLWPCPDLLDRAAAYDIEAP